MAPATLELIGTATHPVSGARSRVLPLDLEVVMTTQTTSLRLVKGTGVRNSTRGGSRWSQRRDTGRGRHYIHIGLARIHRHRVAEVLARLGAESICASTSALVGVTSSGRLW